MRNSTGSMIALAGAAPTCSGCSRSARARLRGPARGAPARCRRARVPRPDAGAPPPADADATAPSKTCLASLRERGVDFMEWPTKGVRTPMRLVGSNLGPLRLVLLERKPGGVMPVMDCELGRALLDAAADLPDGGHPRSVLLGHLRVPHAAPLEEALRARARPRDRRAPVRHGRRPRLRRRARLRAGRGRLARARSGRAASARPSAPRPACCASSPARCASSSAFREIITADDNADHDNHFHIESFPDPLARAKVDPVAPRADERRLTAAVRVTNR